MASKGLYSVLGRKFACEPMGVPRLWASPYQVRGHPSALSAKPTCPPTALLAPCMHPKSELRETRIALRTGPLGKDRTTDLSCSTTLWRKRFLLGSLVISETHRRPRSLNIGPRERARREEPGPPYRHVGSRVARSSPFPCLPKAAS